MAGFDDGTVGMLREVMDRITVSASVTAANLANVDTPGYRALQVSFPEMFGEVSRGLEPARTRAGHLGNAGGPAARAFYSAQPARRMRMDGNTVDVDREMTELAGLQGRYSAAAQLLRKRFALLHYAVSDGKR